MGVCIQSPGISIKQQKTRQNQNRQSFLYNSFTYDPSSTASQSNFFFFDLPHYCQIQYILRKTKVKKSFPQQQLNTYSTSKQSENKLKQLTENLEQHILQIQESVYKFNDLSYTNVLKQNQQVSQNSKDSQPSVQRQRQNQKAFVKKNMDMDSEQMPTNQYSNIHNNNNIINNHNKQNNYNYNNILNFQLVSANINLNDNEFQQSFDLEFKIFLNDTKILTVTGEVSANKWKPKSTNQISLTDIQIDLQNQKIQNKLYRCTNLKLLAVIDQQEIQCTIPCNKITFKYIIPVLQTANIRTKINREPLGHINFRVQYIRDFQEHRKRVINDLQGRKKALCQILENVRDKKNIGVHDRTLVLEENNQSFLSDVNVNIKQEQLYEEQE